MVFIICARINSSGEGSFCFFISEMRINQKPTSVLNSRKFFEAESDSRAGPPAVDRFRHEAPRAGATRRARRESRGQRPWRGARRFRQRDDAGGKRGCERGRVNVPYVGLDLSRVGKIRALEADARVSAGGMQR